MNKENQGISKTLNKAIIEASGDYLAFLDCDDLVVPDAIENVVKFIRLNPHKKHLYSNRININQNNGVIVLVNFQDRSTNANDELMIGMYTSHKLHIEENLLGRMKIMITPYK
jgi:O-antigen biosynthesis protein